MSFLRGQDQQLAGVALMCVACFLRGPDQQLAGVCFKNLHVLHHGRIRSLSRVMPVRTSEFHVSRVAAFAPMQQV